MAKNQSSVPANSGDSDMFGTMKGVLTIVAISGFGIYMAYNTGARVSDRILRQVNKERRKNERDKRREQKERKKEATRSYKLEMAKAKNRRQIFLKPR